MDEKHSAILDAALGSTAASLVYYYITTSLTPIVNLASLAVSVSVLFFLVSIVLVELIGKVRPVVLNLTGR